MLKNSIRAVYQSRRLALTDDELREKTALMVGQFRELSFLPINYLLSHYPWLARNEFDTGACEAVLAKRHPSLVVAWPLILNDLSMEVRTMEKDAFLVANRFGIPEPVNGRSIAPERIDMVFVPLLAFDLRGYRVGYGKGFYDRFLPRCRPDALKLGFSFFDPLPGIKDIDEFDVPLNLCITPKRIYEF